MGLPRFGSLCRKIFTAGTTLHPKIQNLSQCLCNILDDAWTRVNPINWSFSFLYLLITLTWPSSRPLIVTAAEVVDLGISNCLNLNFWLFFICSRHGTRAEVLDRNQKIVANGIHAYKFHVLTQLFCWQTRRAIQAGAAWTTSNIVYWYSIFASLYLCCSPRLPVQSYLHLHLQSAHSDFVLKLASTHWLPQSPPSPRQPDSLQDAKKILVHFQPGPGETIWHDFLACKELSRSTSLCSRGDDIAPMNMVVKRTDPTQRNFMLTTSSFGRDSIAMRQRGIGDWPELFSKKLKEMPMWRSGQHCVMYAIETRSDTGVVRME